MPSEFSGLPASPRETLFRAVDAVIRADPTVRVAFKTVRSWRGDTGDAEPFAVGHTPALRLTPRPISEHWWSTDAQEGWLFIDAEIAVKGSRWEDLDRVWFAVQKAFYPPDRAARHTIETRLREAGARTGLVRCNVMPVDPDMTKSAMISATGQMAILYQILFNS